MTRNSAERLSIHMSPHDAIDPCWSNIGTNAPLGPRCQKLKEILHCRNCRHYIEAGRSLLNRELDPEYRQELTEIFSREKQRIDREVLSAFVFKAGTEWFALSSSLIKEIVEMGLIHTIPHRSNRTFRGLVNVRGKLELCFSIGGILGLERADYSNCSHYRSPERLVVAERDSFRIVFPVTEVKGSLRFPQKDLQSVPVTISHARAAFTRGIINHKDMDIGFLNDAVLFPELLQQLS